ncbi:hypothetical protein ABZS61_06035 [Streptomyces sp. NPDC005566]|uniref:hypothetical protein n=1 Tax=Streptomyces sp. NPDC005566 TaxID=3156886 RepID=UPI0033AC146D
MHDVAFFVSGPLHLYCLLVFVWELDRQTRGRAARKPWIFSVVAAMALAELLDG